MLPLLIHLRYLAVALQVAVVLYVARTMGLGIPLRPLLAIAAALLAFNVGLHLWWRRARDSGPRVLMLQLAADLASLTATLYFAGGPANPFVSLLLVPVAIAAVGLDLAPMLLVGVAAAALYTALMRWHLPLPMVHGRDFQLHILGMWINFLLSVAIMAGVLGRFMAMVKRQREALAQARERALRDESVLALGTLAAGTAHELNTPLTTMGLLLDDWAASGDAPGADDLALMRAQLAHCRTHVRMLAELARRGDADAPVRQRADACLRDCVERLRLLRPGATVRVGALPADAWLDVDATLPQALVHLLNNAADANADESMAATAGREAWIDVAAAIDDGRLRLRIEDRGPGPQAVHDAAARVRAPNGLGIGLTISNASIERAGGDVHRYPRDGGGCVTEVRLPLAPPPEALA